MLKLILSMILSCVVFMVGCGEKSGGKRTVADTSTASGQAPAATTEQTSASGEPTFNLTDASAVAKLAASSSLFLEGAAKTNAMVIKKDGTVAPITEGGHKIYDVKPIKNGVLVAIENARYDYSMYAVTTDGKQFKFDHANRVFVGNTKSGHAYFEDGSYFDGTELKKIKTTLSYLSIDYFSDDFAHVRGENNMQILDTRNMKRFNIQSNEGAFIALSDTVVLVNDGGSKPLLNMTTGERTNIEEMIPGEGTLLNDLAHYVSSGVRTEDGAVFVSQSCGFDESIGAIGGMCHVSPEGAITMISTDTFEPKEGSKLLNYGDYYVVQELNKVVYVKKGEGKKKDILSGFNVTKVEIKGSDVYYFGEDDTGNPVTGKYNLLSQENTEFEVEGNVEDLVTLK